MESPAGFLSPLQVFREIGSREGIRNCLTFVKQGAIAEGLKVGQGLGISVAYR